MKTTLLALAVVLAATPVHAQETIKVGSPIGSGAASSGYDDGNRRDPFVSLIVQKKAAAPAATLKPAVGLAAVAVADVVVTGISKMGSTFMAILHGPDGRSFMGHCGDRLQNGTVKSIDAEGVVFVEQAPDEMGALRPRDVRKTLRQAGEDR